MDAIANDFLCLILCAWNCVCPRHRSVSRSPLGRTGMHVPPTRYHKNFSPEARGDSCSTTQPVECYHLTQTNRYQMTTRKIKWSVQTRGNQPLLACLQLYRSPTATNDLITGILATGPYWKIIPVREVLLLLPRIFFCREFRRSRRNKRGTKFVTDFPPPYAPVYFPSHGCPNLIFNDEIRFSVSGYSC